MLIRILTLALLGVLVAAGPVAAAETAAPPLAASYWQGFIEHWSGVFQKQNGIVLATLVVGAVCLFIITRGKWRK
jgi:hypothetical protein